MNENQLIETFWGEEYHQTTSYKSTIPLARIKKVMKQDCEMMISQESVLLFERASDLFIKELTLRSWIQTELAKRKTLQKSDIVQAVQGSDIYDFLIDIVPQ